MEDNINAEHKSERKPIYVCRKLRVYNWLVKNDEIPFAIIPDRDVPNRIVWIFNDTERLRNLVDEYYRNMPKKEEL